ncbi:CRISPR-associated helicase Cas3' [Paenibacillus sp. J22TS3]|uniref:CRISPR-associated helicase Cas3' n=1 Tax=Paenibacillus sp. J22TS3 TaxID=2807192 RepID=UPI001B07AE7A|nr:CRISPR-associated helicase Cas3' [Paenibacillus sp. J22TS3]GIP22864.1 CRISPR-associated helicase/endonuclease Cas3 [Paenibacillus sp. J22TS3]
MEYIAHIRQKDKKIQTVKQHLEEVQRGCEHYGAKIGVRHLAGLAGLLHDLGKNTGAFKSYIQEAVEHPEAPPRRGSVDHSTAGGRLIYRRFHQNAVKAEDKVTAEWIANCIISHHQGLRDFLDPDAKSPFLERVAVKTEGMEEYEDAVTEFFKHLSEEKFDRYFDKARAEMEHIVKEIQNHKLPPIAASLAIKYIFSCLIDADRTNTRQFEEDERTDWAATSNREFFTRSYDRLMSKVHSFEQGDQASHPINRLRSEMSTQCDEFAEQPSGIYTLSIPTGGGKTLASLRYALKHAIAHGKERIIYVVPYTTIIEQNAAEIRKILLEDELILEHHSNVVEEKEPESEDYDIRMKKIRLAKDSWSSPIIFTTMVQFLNTFYARGTRNSRRMHQLANAVLIFDEVQSVPVKCVSLFNSALNFLNVLGNSSIVLCTATQPALDFVKNNLHLPEQAEIIRNLHEVSRGFKRVELIDHTTAQGWGAEELTTFIEQNMSEVNSVLAILNTKSAVRKLSIQLEQTEWVMNKEVLLFHLSTNMCAAHRKSILDEVRKALENNKKVVCVSTQLIEAGVDISFECVIRSLAGLDSIAQAAGRCNRHGKDPSRKVFIVRSSDENLSRLPEIRIGAEKTERILSEFRREPEQFDHDLLSASAMNHYFKYYFDHIKNELDYYIPKLDKHMFDLLNTNKDLVTHYKNKHGRKRPETLTPTSFATAEQYFEVITNTATSVVVPYNEEAWELILKLNGDMDISELGVTLRRLQQYVVNIYDHELKQLEKNGNVYPLLHGQVLALRKVAYSDSFGVEIEGEGEWSFASV